MEKLYHGYVVNLGGKPSGIPIRKQSPVRFFDRLIVILTESFEHPSFRRRPQHAMIGKVHPAEEIDAGGEGTDEYFVGMQPEIEPQSKEQKLPTIEAAVRKTDMLKFFLRIAWELRALDNKKYALISEKTDELGRMVGGWKKGLETPRR
jgi:hypothetical protein